MKDLDIQVRYDDIDFDFKNIMGGGIIGNTINVIINVIGEEIIKTQKGEMSNLMKDAFHDIINVFPRRNDGQYCKPQNHSHLHLLTAAVDDVDKARYRPAN